MTQIFFRMLFSTDFLNGYINRTIFKNSTKTLISFIFFFYIKSKLKAQTKFVVIIQKLVIVGNQRPVLHTLMRDIIAMGFRQ